MRIGVGYVALIASFAIAAETKEVKVEARPELRVAVVDSSRKTALHEAFATALAAAINQGGGAPIDVKTKSLSADLAAFGLRNGTYDAVLVLAGSLPRPLIMSESARLEATLNSGKNERKAYLIFNTIDDGLTKVLSAAFTPALTSDLFMDTLDGGLDPVSAANAGTKVAAGL